MHTVYCPSTFEDKGRGKSCTVICNHLGRHRQRILSIYVSVCVGKFADWLVQPADKQFNWRMYTVCWVSLIDPQAFKKQNMQRKKHLTRHDAIPYSAIPSPASVFGV